MTGKGRKEGSEKGRRPGQERERTGTDGRRIGEGRKKGRGRTGEGRMKCIRRKEK